MRSLWHFATTFVAVFSANVVHHHVLEILRRKCRLLLGCFDHVLQLFGSVSDVIFLGLWNLDGGLVSHVLVRFHIWKKGVRNSQEVRNWMENTPWKKFFLLVNRTYLDKVCKRRDPSRCEPSLEHHCESLGCIFCKELSCLGAIGDVGRKSLPHWGYKLCPHYITRTLSST